MRILLLAFMFLSFSVYAQTEPEPQETEEKQKVEAACGMCKFDMEGTACELAVRIDGEAYYVDGSKMSDHGEMHGHGGMCTTIREAEVIGEVVDGRFKVTHFELLPLAENTEEDHEEHNH